MPANRMHRGLVTLSASAVAAVYMAGYLRTQSADATIGAPDPAPAAVAAAPPALTPPAVVAVPTPNSRGGARPGQSAAGSTPQTGPLAAPPQSLPPRGAPPPVAAPPVQPAAAVGGTYKDGLYDGQGTSRRGNVWVSVQIQDGRIANVTITRSTLQYPVRDIAGLPAQVVQRQSPQVDIVSRATYSSQAFRGAVAQALAKAA